MPQPASGSRAISSSFLIPLLLSCFFGISAVHDAGQFVVQGADTSAGERRILVHQARHVRDVAVLLERRSKSEACHVSSLGALQQNRQGVNNVTADVVTNELVWHLSSPS